MDLEDLKGVHIVRVPTTLFGGYFTVEPVESTRIDIGERQPPAFKGKQRLWKKIGDLLGKTPPGKIHKFNWDKIF